MGRNRVAFRNSVVWLRRLGNSVAMNGPDTRGRIRTAPMPTWVKVAIDAWTGPLGADRDRRAQIDLDGIIDRPTRSLTRSAWACRKRGRIHRGIVITKPRATSNADEAIVTIRNEIVRDFDTRAGRQAMLIYENARSTNEAIRELRTGGGPGRRLTDDDELVKPI